MNLNLIAIGKFIQDGRKHYAMTQAELAEKLGVSPQSVSNWERGESLPDAALFAGFGEGAPLFGGRHLDGRRQRRHWRLSPLRDLCTDVRGVTRPQSHRRAVGTG